MRIIGGRLKGRIIHPPRNFRARPTTDMAKEGLFNILANRYDFEDIKVLDLFAGSGSISIEFASRGCEKVTCIEKDYFHCQFIRKTNAEYDLNITVIHEDSFRFIGKCTQTFDLIFADPPYDLRDLGLLPEKIFESNLLNPEGIFILEHPKIMNFSVDSRFMEQRKYGNVRFSFFR